ncbi:MAG: hypothetical protein ACOC1O_03950 [bacterium]
MKKYMLIIIVLIILTVTVISCSNKSLTEKIITIINTKCKNQNNCLISINEITDFKWDKMFVFKPGATLQEINEALGIKYKGKPDIKHIIVFMNNDNIVYLEEKIYNPEKPSKVFFNFNDLEENYMIFKKDDAFLKVVTKNVDGKIYYSITPL